MLLVHTNYQARGFIQRAGWLDVLDTNYSIVITYTKSVAFINRVRV